MSIVQDNFPQFAEYAVKVDNDNEFVSNSCDLFTDVGNFSFFMSYDSLKKEIDKGGILRYKKLAETGDYLSHTEELILDTSAIKVLGYREHEISIDKIKYNELKNNTKSVWTEQH